MGKLSEDTPTQLLGVRKGSSQEVSQAILLNAIVSAQRKEVEVGYVYIYILGKTLPKIMGYTFNDFWPNLA